MSPYSLILQNAADLMVRIEQRQGDDIEFRGCRQGLEDAVDQFPETVGADELQVEILVSLHDLLVRSRLIQQQRELLSELAVFKLQRRLHGRIRPGEVGNAVYRD